MLVQIQVKGNNGDTYTFQYGEKADDSYTKTFSFMPYSDALNICRQHDYLNGNNTLENSFVKFFAKLNKQVLPVHERPVSLSAWMLWVTSTTARFPSEWRTIWYNAFDVSIGGYNQDDFHDEMIALGWTANWPPYDSPEGILLRNEPTVRQWSIAYEAKCWELFLRSQQQSNAIRKAMFMLPRD